MLLPLKQGLKLVDRIVHIRSVKGCYATSIKTRIETVFHCAQSTRIVPGCYATSIKTRIETHFVLLFLLVFLWLLCYFH